MTATPPITQADMDVLAIDLRDLMEKIAARNAREKDVWHLLDRSAQMVDRGVDGPFAQDLQNVYALLSAVWSNVRAVSGLRRSMGGDDADEAVGGDESR